MARENVTGGFATGWLGYRIVYARFEIGLVEARAHWISQWLDQASDAGSALIRALREALERIDFAAGVLEWHRPLLVPIYDWVAVAPASAFPPLPPVVHLALTNLRDRFKAGNRTTTSRKTTAPQKTACFADASADEGRVIIGPPAI